LRLFLYKVSGLQDRYILTLDKLVIELTCLSHWAGVSAEIVHLTKIVKEIKL